MPTFYRPKLAIIKSDSAGRVVPVAGLVIIGLAVVAVETLLAWIASWVDVFGTMGVPVVLALPIMFCLLAAGYVAGRRWAPLARRTLAVPPATLTARVVPGLPESRPAELRPAPTRLVSLSDYEPGRVR